MYLFDTLPTGHKSGRNRFSDVLTGSFPGEFRFKDPNAGGGAGGEAGGEEKKFFTQEDVNKMMAEHKRSMQAELAELKKQNTELVKWRGEIETLLDEVAEGAEGEEGEEGEEGAGAAGGGEGGEGAGAEGRAAAETTEKRLRYLEKKYQGQIDGLKKRLDEAEHRATDAETKRRLSERDSILTDALSKAKSVSVDGGLKIFRDNMVYNEDEAKWVFRTAEGVDVDPIEGVAESLPPYLRPAVAGGGSGATDMKGSALVTHVAGLKKKMEEAQKKAAVTGASEDIRVYQRIKDEVKDAEGKLQQSIK